MYLWYNCTLQLAQKHTVLLLLNYNKHAKQKNKYMVKHSKETSPDSALETKTLIGKI